MDDTNSVGARLRLAREMVPDFSQRELDRLAGRREGQCGMIESRAQRVLDPDVALAYATALGCTRRWLVLGEGDPPTAEAIREAVEAARARNADPTDTRDSAAPGAP